MLPRKMAQVAGVLTDLTKSVANLQGINKMLSRLVGIAVKGASWYKAVYKSNQIKEILRKARRAAQNPIPVQERPYSSTTPSLTITSDASEYMWGGVITKNNTDILKTQQLWSKEQSNWHITRQEAQASANMVQIALNYKYIKNNSNLTIKTDSKAAVSTWNKGSAKTKLNDIILPVAVQLARKAVNKTAEHIPRNQNLQADFLSRSIKDKYNYKLNQSVFRTICKQLQIQPTIDLFAADNNHQLPRYYTMRPSPTSTGTDAFKHNWSKEIAYANPPWPLIPKMLDKIIKDQATVLTVLPLWTCKPWWPRVLRLRASKIIKFKGELFSDKFGKFMPPPRWLLAATVLSGRSPMT